MKPEIKTIETHWGNGQVFERYTKKDDDLDGLFELWYSNGNPWVRCTFKEGKFDGLYESWNRNGTPFIRRSYKDDNLVEDLLKKGEDENE